MSGGLWKVNNIDEGLDEMEIYRERCVLADSVPMEELGIDLREERPIYIGNFVNRQQPPYKLSNGGRRMRKEIRIAGFGGQVLSWRATFWARP